MRRVLITLAVLAGLGLAAAGGIVFLGLFNVSARSGHFPGVSWVLHTTYRNSVRLRAPAAETVPDLEDPDLIALGARHFDTGCRVCHAAPGDQRSATIRAMLPAPPHITQAVKDWEPQHLFWIVREGVKMSGMPAWPAGREDDVWPVVAFLTQVGSMEPEDYAALTAPADQTALAVCATCHGREGRSGNAHIPRLDIQETDYLAQSLAAYRAGDRASGIMKHAASLFDEATLQELARHYGAQQPVAADGTGLTAEAERGRALATAAGRDRDVPACGACHGPQPETRAGSFPALAGQHETYLARQLRLWRDASRGGGARAHLMRRAAAELSDDDIEALAAWYSSLPAVKGNAGQ